MRDQFKALNLYEPALIFSVKHHPIKISCDPTLLTKFGKCSISYFTVTSQLANVVYHMQCGFKD